MEGAVASLHSPSLGPAHHRGYRGRRGRSPKHGVEVAEVLGWHLHSLELPSTCGGLQGFIPLPVLQSISL